MVVGLRLPTLGFRVAVVALALAAVCGNYRGVQHGLRIGGAHGHRGHPCRRLDWERWHGRAGRGERAARLPDVVTGLIGQVLAGDTDAIGLLRTPAAEVPDGAGRPPRAMRVSAQLIKLLVHCNTS